MSLSHCHNGRFRARWHVALVQWSPSDPWRWTGPGGRWLNDPPSWCTWRLCTVWHRRWQRSPSAACCHPDQLKLSANCPETVSGRAKGQEAVWVQLHLSVYICMCVCLLSSPSPTLLALLSSTVSLEMVCVISGQRMRRIICSGQTAAFLLALSAKLSTRSNSFSAASEHTIETKVCKHGQSILYYTHKKMQAIFKHHL